MYCIMLSTIAIPSILSTIPYLVIQENEVDLKKREYRDGKETRQG